MTKKSLGIIGVGAFGEFMVHHLAPHFKLVLMDTHKNLGALKKKYKVTIDQLEGIAVCDIIVLAVPVQKLEGVVNQLSPLVKPGTLIVDVASVKIKTTRMMQKCLPKYVDVVGTHPLFGPQSGQFGIQGSNIVICNVRGSRASCVQRFCRRKLGLRAFNATAKEHDQELAYVQCLTHLLAKIVVNINLPSLRFTTKTFDHMMQMTELVRYDSDELFMAIERENPFATRAKKSFFSAARKLERKLT
jgi:prephenate dehydrogenase